MRLKTAGRLTAAAMAFAFATSAPAQTPPAPVLHYLGHEHYSTAAGAFIRYRFEVANRAGYPAEMFAPAPNLPPCGTNANSARTWVDFFGQDGRRLYGFCALRSPSDLGTIWFALPPGQDPPAWVYVEMIDRQTNQRLRSNLERPH